MLNNSMPPIDKHVPRVLILYTGGTIGMVENPETGAHEPLDFQHLASHVPEMNQLHVQVDTLQFEQPLDSSNIKPEHWQHMAEVVVDNYDRYDGFVILHGTDTMAYSATALSFILQNLAKPVIFTGSQLPIGVLRTDGKENLITAIEIAGACDRIGLPMVPEVCIFFQSYLLRGNRSKKFSAEQFNAFASPNYPPIAEVGVHINYAHHYIRHAISNENLTPHYNFDRNVVVLRLFPGISPSIVRSVLNIHGLKGLVLESFGTGNAMTDDWFIEELRSAVDRGLVIVNASQCIGGGVEMGRYDTGNRLQNAGVIGGGEMTTEAVIVKLMFLLGQDYSPEKVCKLMSTNIAGELNEMSLQWREVSDNSIL
ncbi:MAG: asparaginase [Bacteroidales bacterium]|nr:asparaginase [Bacteroidales bacterium]